MQFFNRALFRALDSAKVLELIAKNAFLKATLELGSDQYTTNIRLNTSALPEKVALQMLMQKYLTQDNLTKSIQLELKSLNEVEHLTKSIQLELKSFKEVEHSTTLVLYEYLCYRSVHFRGVAGGGHKHKWPLPIMPDHYYTGPNALEKFIAKFNKIFI